jgi:UDP-N-acetylmuramoylalanine--D-glutamate ligase
MHIQGQQVLVVGLGASGLAMARWCARAGAQVTVLDDRAAPPQAASLAQDIPAARLLHGALDAQALAHGPFQRICISPGLAPARVSDLVDAARAQGLWVGSELGLFTQALRALHETQAYQPQVIAITGTNGKTTATSLTGQLVARAGKTVAVAGNIGPTLLDTLAQAIDTQVLPQVWVLELSSFQLHYAEDFEPTVATVLNLSQDHLDWHTDLQDYARAKARIFGNTGLMLLNRDDGQVMAMLPEPQRVKLQKPVQRAHLCFSAQTPTHAGDYGLEEVNGVVWLVRAAPADETIKRGRNAPEEDLFLQRLMPADALRIRGRHNACNALAAVALASATGCALGPMLFGLREYSGEPHRVQSLGVVGAVEYFDDSKGTNVGATVAALQGLGQDRALVLILGGDGKGQDFAPLAAPVRAYVRAVLLIGRDAALIRQALHNTGVALHDATSMDDAVQQAAALAREGDAVLMSPACASFDMFKDYAHRAVVFTAAVQSLALAQGQMLEQAP